MKLVKIFFYCCLFIQISFSKAQIGNYISNGSFEKLYDCVPPYELRKAIDWKNIGADTNVLGGSINSIGCFVNAPNTGVGYQNPRTGENFYRFSPLCIDLCQYYFARSYPKNRLKMILQANKVYCVKFYTCLLDDSPYATSNFGFLFTDASSDTIKYANGPLSYLTPQLENPITNIITDTLNWVAITGTFVATGTEKYFVIGNFRSNAATTTSLVLHDSTYKFSEYFIDDVSCIEVDLPAYAGPDKSIKPGDSVYIGRENDFAIDSGCTWYRLPNVTMPVKRVSGMWVKPTTTTTYVVKQILECSTEKWDTVVVYMNLVGIEKQKLSSSDLALYPIPAKDYLELKISNADVFNDYTSLLIYNQLGQIVREEEFSFIGNNFELNTENLKDGVYSLTLKSDKSQTVSRRFVISR